MTRDRPIRRFFRHRLLAPLLLGAVLATGVQQAYAFEIFGIRLFGSEPEQGIDVIGEPQFYEVEFLVTGDDGLEDRLRGASNLWSDRDEPASGVAGLLAKARGDYRRLLAALYGDGRYGGTISIQVEGREAADIPADATLPATARVLVRVDTGPLFTFGEAAIVNEAAPPLDRRQPLDDPREEGFAPGEVARSGTILRAERLAVEAWRYQGHAKAEVAERRVEAAHDTNRVDARITIDPGRRAHYGPIGVTGAERLDPAWLAWMTGLGYGEVYDPDDLARAGTRLARLDVFRSQRFEEAAEIDPAGLLPITLVVQERLPRRIGIGGSYSTVDGIGAEAFWLHRNLFGRAERLRLDARVAGIGRSYRPQEWTYRLGASFVKPGIYTPDTDFIASVQGDRERLDLYTRTGVSAEAGFTHIFSDVLSGRLVVNAAHARFADGRRVEYGPREFTTLGVSGGLTYDGRDDPTDATRGFYVDTVLEPYYEFRFGNAAIRAVSEGRAYYGFGADNGIVLAGRLRLGTLAGSSIDETPPDRLFLAGGGGSVRGYAFRSIGVRQADGTITGGRSLVEASAELRLRFTETIGAVGFVDAGYVGADPVPDFSQRFRLGAGVGLRYHTGFGPIRLDVAVPLNRRPTDPRVALYVGIGQAF